MSTNIEKRLERIEKLLTSLLTRLAILEEKLRTMGYDSSELKTAYHLMSILSIPPILALEASRRFYSVLSSYKKFLDDISKCIIEVLSTCEELSISEIARRVKSLRGKSSRRIIAEKLRMLENLGIVISKAYPNKKLYVLRKCLSEKYEK